MHILNVDSYKTSHYLQYPPGTEYVSSYIEARGGAESTLFFGLQMYIEKYLEHPITRKEIDEAEEIILAHGLPFNRAGWEHILKAHRGYLPLRIQAVAEGTHVPIGNVLVQVQNTDPMVPWLTSYVETALLRAVWYPTTVATRSWDCRRIIKNFLEITADNTEVAFKLHDFGARGVSSKESAGIGGLAHLLAFQGTDTMEAIVYGRKYYDTKMAGFSIPAAEHSTITAWGREFEASAYENMIDQFSKPGAVYAVVSDSYDLETACRDLWGTKLKDKVISSGGTLVVRPDSGDPITSIRQTFRALFAKFGRRINSKGYYMLPDCVRIIQGDGVSPEAINDILGSLMISGVSAENIAFGMGGELLQKVNRDTYQFAMKASAISVDGEWRDVYKEAPGKKSKRGRLDLVEGMKTVRAGSGAPSLLRTVYEDGVLMNRQSLSTIRLKANS